MSALIAICGVSTFLVFHREYEDGLIGRAGLAAMAVSSLVMLVQIAHGERYVLMPETQLIVIGAAVFMLRHAYRFVRWRISGEGSWRGRGKG